MSKSTKLNANAEAWDPIKSRAPEINRCLFITFSNGYPLSHYQITRFFNYKFGPYVERVYVHWPLVKEKDMYIPAIALFGKVVFKMSSVPAYILGGRNETGFIVDGRPLWCKKFEPKNRRSSVRINPN